jgi:uncharacterized membrane protein
MIREATMSFNAIAEHLVFGIEVAGVGVIVIGLALVVLSAIKKWIAEKQPAAAYAYARHGIGRSLMLGLDLLIASEIIRSIMAETLESVSVLGLTIVIRTFLSLTLEIEIEGQLPWKRRGNGS